MPETIHTTDAAECGITKNGFEIITIAEMNEFLRLNPDFDRPNRLEFYCLIAVCTGSGFHIIDYQEVQVGGGDIIMVAPGQVHRFDSRAMLTGYVLSFTADFIFQTGRDIEIINRFALFDPLIPSPKIKNTPESTIVQVWLEEMYRCYQGKRDEYRMDILRNLLKALIFKFEQGMAQSRIAMDSTPDYRDFHAFRSLLEQRYAQSRQVLYYARSLAVSAKKLNLLTQRYSGKSITWPEFTI